MSLKRSSVNRRVSRVAKVAALASRPGSPGEQVAAQAALLRIGAERPAPRTTHLTDADIRRLPVPATGYTIVWDSDVIGFGVRVTAGGARSFVFNYRVRDSGQERRVTIGRFPNWTTGAARRKARQLHRQVDDGGDPRGDFEEEREAPTAAELCDRFEREHLPRKRPATQDAYRRLIRLHIKPHFGQFTKVADVTFSDVDRLHRAITQKGSVYSANRAVAVLSKMMNLAIKWQMRSDNPCRGVEKNSEVKRKRYLSGDELKRLTAALAGHDDKQFSAIILLLVLTGARRGEVLGMRTADLDFVKGIWTKPGSTTKQKVDHVVPLSAAALEVLKKIKPRGEFVFPSDSKTGHVVEIKKGWASLCKAAGITGLRVHDLRHSFASQLASSGASLPLIGALLGHSNPITTSRYSHLIQDVERAAVEKVGRVVSNAGNDATQKRRPRKPRRSEPSTEEVDTARGRV